MFRLIKAVLNGFVSAPLKLVQPKTQTMWNPVFIAFFICLFQMVD